MINPEFQRNFWLELTPHRLLAVPLISALLLTLGLALNDWRLDKTIALGALWLFVLFCGVIGTKKAAAAIHDEVAGRTWDWQRMSGLNPWAMTWGKLFGKTLLTWYFGLCALSVALLGLIQDKVSHEGWQWYLLALLGVLLSQGLGFFFNLIYIRNRPQDAIGRFSGSLYLLVLMGVITLFSLLAQTKAGQVSWFIWQIDTLDFAIFSLLAFWLWTLMGAYRLMRRELNHGALPWVWLAFLVFCALYLTGFIHKSRADWLLAIYLCWHGLTILTIFIETKDPVMLRAMLTGLRQRRLGQVLQLMPAWLGAMLLTSLALLALLLLPQRIPVLSWVLMGLHPDFSIASLALVFWLFLLRDCALMLSLSLSGEARRAEATALIYLLLLYVAIPALLHAIGWSSLTPFFQPRADLPLTLALSGALLSAIFGLGVLFYQWRRLAASSLSDLDR
jgi:hypothetical protein